MRRLLTIILIILLAGMIFAGTGVASDLLKGEFRLYTDYRLDGSDEHPALKTDLDLIYTKATWDDEFLVEVNYTGNLKDENLNFNLGEVYYKYYGVNYDITVGQQVINWGTAVEFNPTDNLNPVDSTNLFAENQPIPMVYGSYYLNNNYSLIGTIIPYHRPVKDAVEIQGNVFTAEPVADNLENNEYALKLSAKGAKGFDYSVSYFHGYEDIPTIGFKQTPMGPQPDPTNIYYRSQSIIGADIATSYEGIGLWGEVAYNMPEDGEEYYSAVAGADYKFTGGYYAEGQLIYQKDKMLNENTLIQGAVEKDIRTIHTMRMGMVYNPGTEGMMIKPEVDFSLTDAVTLNVSYQYLEGKVLETDMEDALPLTGDSLQAELSYAF